jgi:peptidoglycan/LPS O-acetylase OafA/YrhL
MQFYLFWPAVLSYFSPEAVVIFAASAILFAPFSRILEFSLESPQWWLTSNMDLLMAGCLAALALTKRPERFAKYLSSYPPLLRSLGLALIVAPVLTGRNFPDYWLQIMFGPSIQAVGCAYLIASYAFGPKGAIKRLLNSRVLNFFGLISYSLYVWQEAFFIWPSDFGFERLQTYEWPTNLISMLSVAIVSYFFLEKPLASIRKKFSMGTKT